MNCGQNTEFLNVKTGGTNSDHWVLKPIWKLKNHFEVLGARRVGQTARDMLMTHKHQKPPYKI